MARMRRPKSTTATVNGGITASITMASLAFSTNSSTSPPSSCTEWRMAMLSSEPTTPSMMATSPASRPTSSPVRREWKNVASCSSRLSNTLRRMSATARSPSQLMV